MRVNKRLLRMLLKEEASELVNPAPREIQVPAVVRALLIKSYGRYAWPAPIAVQRKASEADRMLRRIVVGLWLEKQRGNNA